MRRYVITLLVIAFLVGTLFKAADQTGVRLMKMFATLGIFFFGVVGTMALSRWQSRTGLKEIEAALKQGESAGLIITDWAQQQGGARPDYVVVGPGGVAAVCLEETPGATRAKKAALNAAKGRERTSAAANWMRERLAATAISNSPLGETMRDLPITALLVMTRRRAGGSYSADNVAVINPDQLDESLRSLRNQQLLDEADRIKLTRLLRQA